MVLTTEKQPEADDCGRGCGKKYVYDIDAREGGFRQDFGNTIHSKFGAANTSVYLDHRYTRQWEHFLGRQKFTIHNMSTLQFGSAADLRSGEPREWAYTERPNGDYRYYERRHFAGTTDSQLDEFTNLDKAVYGRLCPPPPPPPRPCRPWWLPFSQINIR